MSTLNLNCCTERLDEVTFEGLSEGALNIMVVEDIDGMEKIGEVILSPSDAMKLRDFMNKHCKEFDLNG